MLFLVKHAGSVCPKTNLKKPWGVAGNSDEVNEGKKSSDKNKVVKRKPGKVTNKLERAKRGKRGNKVQRNGD